MADINELKAARQKKLQELLDLGVEPYPEKTPKHTPIAELLDSFAKRAKSGRPVTGVGRIMGMRGHGALLFLDLRDMGGEIQVLASKKEMGKDAFAQMQLLDLGDIVAISGPLAKTKRGEESIQAKKVTLLTKSLRPLPDTWYGLKDTDERFRDREVDFLLNPESVERIKTRARVLASLRESMEKEDFIEVETPVLQAVPGGATAKPFETKLNALDMQLYLRVAPELYLKRLIVGGLERVYELGPSFRNEGMDTTHNPEFTSLEFYWAYQDLEGLIAFTEKLLKKTVKDALGKTKVSYRGKTYDFGKKFARVEYTEALKKHAGVDVLTASDKDIASAAKKFGVPTKDVVRAQMIDHLFKKAVAPNLPEPCFVLHHPLALSPLAKASAENPNIAQRLHVYVGGFEAVNAYAELNDPEEQRNRFADEAKKRKAGDDEAQRKDEDFIRALEYGLPPTAGWAVGVDRFVMFLTDAPSIREVIAFPTMRPKDRS